MDTIINAVYLTAVIPGYRPIAQLYTDYRSAIVGSCARKTNHPPLKFSNLRRCAGGFPGRGAAKI
jgi:hypothetical protein